MSKAVAAVSEPAALIVAAVSEPAAVSEAELDAVLDLAALSQGTWLDVTGATPYDKLFVKVAGPAGKALGAVEVVVPGCGTGTCGKVSFKTLKETDVVEGEGGRLKLLAYARSMMCKEFTVTVEGATSGAVTLPLPPFSPEWTRHTLGEGVVLQVLSQRAEDGAIASKAQLDALEMESKTFELTVAEPGEKAVPPWRQPRGKSMVS